MSNDHESLVGAAELDAWGINDINFNSFIQQQQTILGQQESNKEVVTTYDEKGDEKQEKQSSLKIQTNEVVDNDSHSSKQPHFQQDQFFQEFQQQTQGRMKKKTSHKKKSKRQEQKNSSIEVTAKDDEDNDNGGDESSSITEPENISVTNNVHISQKVQNAPKKQQTLPALPLEPLLLDQTLMTPLITSNQNDQKVIRVKILQQLSMYQLVIQQKISTNAFSYYDVLHFDFSKLVQKSQTDSNDVLFEIYRDELIFLRNLAVLTKQNIKYVWSRLGIEYRSHLMSIINNMSPYFKEINVLKSYFPEPSMKSVCLFEEKKPSYEKNRIKKALDNLPDFNMQESVPYKWMKDEFGKIIMHSQFMSIFNILKNKLPERFVPDRNASRNAVLRFKWLSDIWENDDVRLIVQDLIRCAIKGQDQGHPVISVA